MNFGFTAEQQAMRDAVRKFASERVAPYYSDIGGRSVIDRELMAEMGGLGLIAPELATSFGGGGAGYIASGIVIEEVARADINTSVVQLLGALTSQILSENADEDLSTAWLPQIIGGKALMALALTEPSGGSDAAALQLKMRRVGDAFILDGEKTSITFADQADAAVLFARTGTPADGAAGVSAVFVPLDLAGITRTRFHDTGQHSIGRGSLFFEGVKVPAGNLLGNEGRGFAQVLRGFDFSRALIGLECLAVAQVSLEETWSHVTERHAFGQPLSAFQGVSHRLAELDTQVQAARLLCYQTLWLKEQGLPHTAEAAMIKWWGPKLAFEAIHQCLLFHGHAGYSRDLPYEQRMRDVMGFHLGDGTAEIMKTVVARQRAGRENVPY